MEMKLNFVLRHYLTQAVLDRDKITITLNNNKKKRKIKALQLVEKAVRAEAIAEQRAIHFSLILNWINDEGCGHSLR